MQAAVRLNSIINQRAYGYDSLPQRRRDDADWIALGGQARLDALMKDPDIYAYIAKGSGGSGFFSGLFSSVQSFAGEAGIKEGLVLAGFAMGANAFGAFGQPAAAAAQSAAGQAMAATIYDPIAAMTGAGVGVSDAVIAATAASAPGVAGAGAAIAEMQGAQWGALITGNVAAPVATVFDLAAKVPTQAQDLLTARPAAQSAAQEVVQTTGGGMGTIFDNISGTISSIGNTVSSAYGTVLDTQIKMAQLDVLKAQAKADLYQQPVTGGVVSGGGLNIGMIGIMALVALGGLMLYMRKG